LCQDYLLRWDLLYIVCGNCIKVLGLLLGQELGVLAYGALLGREIVLLLLDAGLLLCGSFFGSLFLLLPLLLGGSLALLLLSGLLLLGGFLVLLSFLGGSLCFGLGFGGRSRFSFLLQAELLLFGMLLVCEGGTGRKVLRFLLCVIHVLGIVLDVDCRGLGGRLGGRERLLLARGLLLEFVIDAQRGMGGTWVGLDVTQGGAMLLLLAQGRFVAAQGAAGLVTASLAFATAAAGCLQGRPCQVLREIFLVLLVSHKQHALFSDKLRVGPPAALQLRKYQLFNNFIILFI